ncbi:hypothetical protein [Candidatus Thiothrix anitrata]|uniref:Uncharacterized protein n=1 Tax=Candidatus Thiothrix anitrata TaxID=2823902 RepID=A0ABX7X2M0_9GAMM|nr:hypothetical protein [Candidatus Thiothrix anitrata]QTR50156.1 hypothetical protein J8380_00790 [Candidatus Thiothrix anitrata]
MFKLKPLASAITLSLVTGIAVAAAPVAQFCKTKSLLPTATLAAKLTLPNPTSLKSASAKCVKPP